MATYTPSTNIDPTKAVYGEKSQGVLALQKALNAKGAGLKEDALYGPLTQAAFQKYNQTTQPDTSKPIGSTFIMPTVSTQDENTKYAQDILGKQMRDEDIVDTSAIRAKTLSDFQDRINAINQVYADQLARARQEGVGRIGQTTSILSNRGLTGSLRGGAIAEGTLTQNRKIEEAIDAEKNAAISAIYNEVNATANSEAQRRRQAIESGAKGYIEFIKGQDENKKTNIGNIAGAFIAQGIDPSTLSSEELTAIASKIGASANDILSTYKQKQYETNQANIKANPAKELSQGEALYTYDPATGSYKQVGYNPKTSTAKGGMGGTIPSGSYKNDLDAIIGATLVTIPSKFGQEQFNAQLNKSRNDADKINLIASTVLKNSPNEIKTDFSNQSIAVSNIDKAIAEIDKGAKTGIINSKLQKGFNLLGKDYDPALASVAAYIVSAVQPYRNSVTGAAWGSQEENEYQQLFGSTAYSPAELKQRLERLKGIMINKSVQGLNTFVNPLNNYANPFTPNTQNIQGTTPNTITIYSIKTGQPAQIPADKLQQALSSGLFRQ